MPEASTITRDFLLSLINAQLQIRLLGFQNIFTCKYSRQAKHFLQHSHPVGVISHSQLFNKVHLDTMDAHKASLHTVLPVLSMNNTDEQNKKIKMKIRGFFVVILSDFFSHLSLVLNWEGDTQLNCYGAHCSDHCSSGASFSRLAMGRFF